MLGTGRANAQRQAAFRMRPIRFALIVVAGTSGGLSSSACGKDAPVSPVPSESDAGGAGESGAGGEIGLSPRSLMAGGSFGGAKAAGSGGTDQLGGGGSCGGTCAEDTTGWSKPMLLEEHDGKAFKNPKVGTDARGNVLVAWERDSPSRGSIWVNVYEASRGAWRGEMDLLGGDVDEHTGDPSSLSDRVRGRTCSIGTNSRTRDKRAPCE